MIVVKLEMWPGGDEKRAQEFGRAYIHNTVKTTNQTSGAKGDYDGTLIGGVWGTGYYRPTNRPWLSGGKVEEFDRVNRGAWDLLYLVLKKMIGYRNDPKPVNRNRPASAKPLFSRD